MTTQIVRQSREIDGKGRTVRELLAGRKYSIDYYQREYSKTAILSNAILAAANAI